MPRLMDEIRRRKVGRAAIAYTAVAFVVLQVADVALPPLGTPDWVLAALVVLGALGFPVAIALAWAFDVTPEGIVRTEPAAPSAARRRLLDRRAWLLIASGAMLSVGTGASYAWWRYVPDGSLDADQVAVMPFRVSGDASLSYLREGMVDLFSTSLSGPAGMRTADPRSVLSAWSRMASGDNADLPAESAKLVARSVGAGRMLLGSVVGTPADVTVSASLFRVSGAGRRIDATARGPAEEVPDLIDQLTAKLLSLDAGETEQRLATLTSTSLPALRAYLAGQAAYRRSRFDEAGQAFDRAVAADSSFALAALGLYLTDGWGDSRTPNMPRAARLAWENRERLSSQDRLFLEAVLGPSYPRPSTIDEEIRHWEQTLPALPDRADALFLYGDLLVHYGGLADRPDHTAQAVRAFERSLALDSSFTPALTHLLDDAFVRKDSSEVRRLFALLERADTSYASATYQYWARIGFFADDAQRQATRERLAELPLTDLRWLGFNLYYEISDVHDARLVAAAAIRRALTSPERAEALADAYNLALNSGRPDEATSYAEQALALRLDEHGWNMRLLLDGLFWQGDMAAARRAAARLDSALQDPAALQDASLQPHICALGIWHAWQANATDARRLARVAEARSGDAEPPALTGELCSRTIRSIIAHGAGAADAPAELERADAIARLGPRGSASVLRAINFSLARLFEEQGRPMDALRAVRRHEVTPELAVQYSTVLHEKGRLAELTGDRQAAIQAYSSFLHLRSDPEPALEPHVAHVAATLARLMTEMQRD
jgi:eukaryotic-like serine/threonine-protein kinase